MPRSPGPGGGVPVVISSLNLSCSRAAIAASRMSRFFYEKKLPFVNAHALSSQEKDAAQMCVLR